MCDPKYTKHLPMLSYFEPPAEKMNPVTKKPNMAKEHKYEGEASPKGLGAFAKKIMPAYREVIKSEK